VRYRGFVKKWRHNYGIISSATGEDIKFKKRFVPQEFLAENYGQVPEGTVVEFNVVSRDGERKARNIRFLEAGAALGSFVDLGLEPEVIQGAAAALGCDPRENPDAPSLIVPAPVQSEAIPRILAGEDLVIAAETGSGKSLAYMLPLVQLVQKLERERSMDYGLGFRPSSPLGLVLCPTRELALQACRILKLVCHHARLRVRCVHGGTGTWVRQRKEISEIVDVLVATPDRLLKFHESKDLKFTDIAYVAIDEADFLLTQGFGELEEIFGAISKYSRHKDILRYLHITASITKPLWKIFQEDPRFRHMRVLESRALHKPQNNCAHTFIAVKGRDKLEMLISLLRPELLGAAKSKQTLVFCNSVSSCRSIGFKLKEVFEANRNGRFIGVLNKEMPADEREEVLQKFTRGEHKIIICTDIAQRGLDLPNCGQVVNFDFPLNSIDYLHRAGRTARYGEPGKVTSFVKKGDKWLAKAIERSCQLGKPINDLSADKRDYLRGGALNHLIARHPRASAAERGLPAPKPYDGSLR